MYMMTCMYTFWWRHNILHLTYVPGFHTSGPQVPNTYFPYTFFFSKIQCCSRLVSEIYFHISNKKQSNYKMSYIWLCIFIPIIVSGEIYSNIWLNQELCPLWKKYPQHEVGGSYIVIKNSDAWALPDIELIYMVKNTLITINYGTYLLYFGIFHSKSVILLGLCHFFAKNKFSSIFTQWFKDELSY